MAILTSGFVKSGSGGDGSNVGAGAVGCVLALVVIACRAAVSVAVIAVIKFLRFMVCAVWLWFSVLVAVGGGKPPNVFYCLGLCVSWVVGVFAFMGLWLALETLKICFGVTWFSEISNFAGFGLRIGFITCCNSLCFRALVGVK